MSAAKKLAELERRINALQPLKWSRLPGDRVGLRFGDDFPVVVVPAYAVTFLVTGQDMSHTADHGSRKHSTHRNDDGQRNKLRRE